MPSYSIAEAKNGFPRLIDKALAGEEVIITRHGKVVAELRPKQDGVERPSFDYGALLERTEARGGVGLTSVQLLDAMYEEAEG